MQDRTKIRQKQRNLEKKISSVRAQRLHTAEIRKIICIIWNPPGSNRLRHAPVHVCTQKHLIKALPHCYIIIICLVLYICIFFFVGDLDTERARFLSLSLSLPFISIRPQSACVARQKLFVCPEVFGRLSQIHDVAA